MESGKVVNKELVRVGVSGLVLAGIFYVMWQISPTACAVVLFEVPYLLAIFLACLALGFLPVRALAKHLTLGQGLVTAITCGAGILAILVMGLGLVGLLHARVFWLAMVGSLSIVGAIVLYRKVQSAWAQEQVVFEAGRYWVVLLGGVVPFVILALLCAAIPPGVLWSAEGGGYDVLEYHLGAPKEWFQAGRIEFLGHNVYANFPANAEMLYLLAMAMKGDAIGAVYLAQLLHVSLAVLFVGAIWVFSRPWGYKAACFATVAAGTCSWVAYLAPLAYVEMGMLLSGAVATGLILRMTDEEITSPVRYAALIGLVLGVGAGFKYTALAMIAGPVIVVGFVFFARKTTFKKALAATAVMAGVCVAAIGPYFVRNFVWTGNPVFPLGYQYLGGRGWDVKSAQRWKAGHEAKADEKPIAARLKRLYWAGLDNYLVDLVAAEHYRSKGDFTRANEFLNPPPIMDLPKFGLAVLVLPWLVFFTRRQTVADWLLVLVFLMQTAVWLFATHLQARFLVPWLVVLPFLVGRTALAFGRGRFSIGMIVITLIMIASVAMNFDETYRRYLRHTYAGEEPIHWFGQENAFVSGQIPGFEYLETVNKDVGARTILLGDARPFYVRGEAIYWTVFNRNEFAEAAVKNMRAVKDYIAKARPDFIYVDWSEIIRLSRTYGFDGSITPAVISNLSSPGRYTVRRVEKWGPFLPYMGREVPARILYAVTHKEERKVERTKVKGVRKGLRPPTNVSPSADENVPIPGEQ